MWRPAFSIAALLDLESAAEVERAGLHERARESAETVLAEMLDEDANKESQTRGIADVQ